MSIVGDVFNDVFVVLFFLFFKKFLLELELFFFVFVRLISGGDMIVSVIFVMDGFFFGIFVVIEWILSEFEEEVSVIEGL